MKLEGSAGLSPRKKHYRVRFLLKVARLLRVPIDVHQTFFAPGK